MPHALAEISLLLLAQLRPNITFNPRTNILLGSVLAALAVAFVVGRALRRQPESTLSPAAIRTFNLRIWAWWMMFLILVGGLWLGYVPTVVFFGLISFWALREFITMTPTRRGDHRTLFWTFVVFTPLHYVLVGLGREYYQFYTVMIPVYASLFIPARIAIAGDPKRFLERVAKIQAGLLICVYCLSHAPAMLDLQLTTGPGGQRWVLEEKAPQASSSPMAPEESPVAPEESTTSPPDESAAPSVSEATPPTTQDDLNIYGSTASVLFFFVLIVQMNDVFQYMWGQLLGRHVIAPQINASRTWEGLIGGVLSTMLLGMLLSWATPYGLFWAGPIAGAVAFAGFAGSMTMSAIKRDRGVKDYGTLVSGHAGVLDRIDSLCFAAPVFFHITRFFFSTMQ